MEQISESEVNMYSQILCGTQRTNISFFSNEGRTFFHGGLDPSPKFPEFSIFIIHILMVLGSYLSNYFL